MCTTDDELPPVNFVLPGDELPLPLPLPVPGSKNTAIKIGPGLAHIPPDAVVPVTAGELNVDKKKQMIWVEADGKRVKKKLTTPIQQLFFLSYPSPREETEGKKIDLKKPVHPAPSRFCHRGRQPLRFRLLPLHNPKLPEHRCPAPTPCVRECHEED